jgi:hypothetical protein
MTMRYPAFCGIVDAINVQPFFLDGTSDHAFQTVKVAAGQILRAGSVLGVKTADGKAYFCVKAAGDGSEVPHGILMENLDTSAGDVEVGLLVHTSAQINESQVVFDASWTLPDIKLALRRAGLFIRRALYSAA